MLLRTLEKRGEGCYVYNAEEREGARPGVANYWIRARVVLVLHTANSCSFQRNICKKVSNFVFFSCLPKCI